LVPVNADVPGVEVILLPEQDDHVNPAGVKGIGEHSFGRPRFPGPRKSPE
jgi:CO/xanthine dehydrogenase Mo-binding subunit